MQTTKALTARINRILKQFTRDDDPELIDYVSGINEPEYPAIDDGDYRDPLKSNRPEWVQKDLTGWK